jgi:ribosomal protein S17
MFQIFDIASSILSEQQDTKTMLLRKAIGERLPITINYSGPSNEVKSGKRIDIQPVIMGKNAKSGNPVIWAFVSKGVSKKGLPNWKMFRVDRIKEVNINMGAQPFKLSDVPGFVKGKAPSAMKSLSSVDILSPYWFEDDKRYAKSPITKPAPKPQPTAQPKPQPQKQTVPVPQEPVKPEEPKTIENPETSNKDYTNDIVNLLKTKVNDVNGQKTIKTNEYQDVIKDLYNKKEQEWKNYQRQVGKNDRPGEGTRARFNNTSKSEIDNILSKENIKVSDENNSETLSEIQNRFKQLINS